MNSSANGHQDDDGHAVDSELDCDLDDDDGPKVPLMEQAAGLLRHIWFEFKYNVLSRFICDHAHNSFSL